MVTPGNKGNRSASRGRGYRSRLNKAEQDALGAIAAAHGYTAIVDNGITLRPAVVFTLAIIGGEVATILLSDEDRRHAIETLLRSSDDVLVDIGRQLAQAPCG